jgi:hypothetical protein
MRNFVAGAGLLGLIFGLTLPPLVAQERGEGKMMKHHETVTIDKPFNDVVLKVNEDVKKAGLLTLAEIDWNRISSMKGGMDMPGGHRLEEAATNVRTFYLGEEAHVRKVLDEPEHGLWAYPFVLCEKGGKTEALYFRPTVKIEELKKHGILTAEEADKKMTEAKECEKKLDNFIEYLKGTRSS